MIGSTVLGALFLVFLIAMGVISTVKNKYPNWLNAAGLVVGITGAALGYSVNPYEENPLTLSLVGFGVLLTLGFVAALVGLVTPGQAKFFIASASFLGWGWTLAAVGLGFVLHTIFALMELLQRRGLESPPTPEEASLELPSFHGVAYSMCFLLAGAYLFFRIQP